MGEYADYALERMEAGDFGLGSVTKHIKKTSSKISKNKKQDKKCLHCGAVVFWKDVDKKWTLFHYNEKGLKEQHHCTKKEKLCNNCGSEFMWKQIKGNWVPHDLNGNVHVCKPKEHDTIPEISDDEIKERFGS